MDLGSEGDPPVDPGRPRRPGRGAESDVGLGYDHRDPRAFSSQYRDPSYSILVARDHSGTPLETCPRRTTPHTPPRDFSPWTVRSESETTGRFQSVPGTDNVRTHGSRSHPGPLFLAYFRITVTPDHVS